MISFPHLVSQHLERRAALFAGVLAGVVVLTGCITDPNIRDMQLDVHQTKLDVGGLQASQSAEFRKMQYTLEEIQKSLEAQRKADKDFADNVEQRLTAMHEDVAKIAVGSETKPMADSGSYMGSSVGVGPSTSAAAPAASVDQQSVLRQAEEEYARGEYDKAIELYSQFLVSGANTASGALANYALARCYYAKGDYETALQAFDYVIETYPASGEIIPKSLDSRALCEYKLSRFDAAKVTLQKIQATYPDYDPERIKAILSQIPK